MVGFTICVDKYELRRIVKIHSAEAGVFIFEYRWR
jgi:hypothetical protein